jgi:hypothetical protein
MSRVVILGIASGGKVLRSPGEIETFCREHLRSGN